MEAQALIRLRLISLDFSLQRPTKGVEVTHSPFSHPPSPLFKVPILRLFCATPTGQKVVAHVHQVFPYLMVAYEGGLDEKEVYRTIYQLGHSINHALALSLKQNPELVDRTQYIAAITLVKGIPFYGFHSKYSYFLKIYLLDPGLMTRVVELLSKGVVMGKRFQTYESHIPYLPQFMIDHGLLGMDYMDVADARFRRPLKDVERTNSSQPASSFFTSQTIPSNLIWPEDHPLSQRESFCELEIDVLAGDILNRTRIQERPRKALIDLLNGTQQLSTKLVPSLKSLWEDEERRRTRKNMGPFHLNLLHLNHNPFLKLNKLY
ncbi:ribonuclease H-like protein [Rhizoclosmatium globosum]|uniref:Ribonuclease H-like protein n=1 Tax=Rhizoclosmatium globosum TaxID=329046 RepID=A0A1Y2CHT8_9FUNG|nr:ribonuclease H-like protein [Rhizoclosmatium globosum]|eukprot:ORY46572.1 ribonuclease H-like protein [Rhizoclosmatium globosum]